MQKILLKNRIVDLFARITNFFLIFAIPYFGSIHLTSEELTLLLIVSSWLAFINLLDLGLGNAVVNASASKNPGSFSNETWQIFISSKLIIFILIVFLVLIYFLFKDHLNFKLLEPLDKKLFFVPFLLLITSVSKKILYSHLLLYKTQFFLIFSNILSFSLLCLYQKFNLSSYIFLSFVGQIIVGITSLIYLLTKLRPIRTTFQQIYIKIYKLTNDSFWFFLLAVAGLFFFIFDTPLVVSKISSNEALDYTSSMRVFTIMVQISAVVSAPLWAYYKITSNRSSLIAPKIFNVSVLLLSFAFLYIAITVISKNYIFNFWLNGLSQPNSYLFLLAGFVSSLIIIHTVFEMGMNSKNKIKYQFYSMFCCSIILYSYLFFEPVEFNLINFLTLKLSLIGANIINYYLSFRNTEKTIKT